MTSSLMEALVFRPNANPPYNQWVFLHIELVLITQVKLIFGNQQVEVVNTVTVHMTVPTDTLSDVV